MEKIKDEILKFDHVDKRFGYVHALNQITFNVRRGEVHCLVGENGAGKSTLIKCLSGAYVADSGQILLDGNDITGCSPQKAIEFGISVVYQNMNIVPYMKVVDNILLGSEFHVSGFVQRKRNEEAVKPYLEMVGLDVDPHTPMGALSLAQQQMVLIAKAVYKKTKVLVLDEPTAMLSDEEVNTLFNIVKKLKKQGIAILYISHRLQELYEIGDRVTVLKDGTHVGCYDIANTDTKQLIYHMVGREIKDIYPQRKRIAGQPVLKAEQISNSTLKNISFTLYEGEVLGLAGLVGSGRSEVLRALMGVDQKDQGTVIFHNQVINVRHPSQAIKAGIGMVPEDRYEQGMTSCLSVEQNLVDIYTRIHARAGFIKHKQNANIAEKYIQKLSIKTPNKNQELGKLSGGNQQKVILAKWLCINPSVLLLDEPTQGIDVGTKVELYQLIDQLAREKMGVILVSSDMTELLNLCDRILVLRDGEITAELDGQTTTERELLSYAMR